MQMFYFTWKNNDFFMEASFPVIPVYFLGQCGSHSSLNFMAWPNPHHPSAVLSCAHTENETLEPGKRKPGKQNSCLAHFIHFIII